LIQKFAESQSCSGLKRKTTFRLNAVESVLVAPRVENSNQFLQDLRELATFQDNT